MLEHFLIFIKHHCNLLWRIIEWSNGSLFSLLYKSKMDKILHDVFKEFTFPPFHFKKLVESDISDLYYLIKLQEASDLEYFHPHNFDLKSLKAQIKNKGFLMMGAFEGEKIIGYFFLRFFVNKKCFVGRLINKDRRGQGIGEIMNNIMYHTAWRMNFRCLSTISKNNYSVMRAHAKNPFVVIRKELGNDYLLVEFRKSKDFRSRVTIT